MLRRGEGECVKHNYSIKEKHSPESEIILEKIQLIILQQIKLLLLLLQTFILLF